MFNLFIVVSLFFNQLFSMEIKPEEIYKGRDEIAQDNNIYKEDLFLFKSMDTSWEDKLLEIALSYNNSIEPNENMKRFFRRIGLELLSFYEEDIKKQLKKKKIMLSCLYKIKLQNTSIDIFYLDKLVDLNCCEESSNSFAISKTALIVFDIANIPKELRKKIINFLSDRYGITINKKNDNYYFFFGLNKVESNGCCDGDDRRSIDNLDQSRAFAGFLFAVQDSFNLSEEQIFIIYRFLLAWRKKSKIKDIDYDEKKYWEFYDYKYSKYFLTNNDINNSEQEQEKDSSTDCCSCQCDQDGVGCFMSCSIL